jgi:hypothetical protein
VDTHGGSFRIIVISTALIDITAIITVAALIVATTPLKASTSEASPVATPLIMLLVVSTPTIALLGRTTTTIMIIIMIVVVVLVSLPATSVRVELSEGVLIVVVNLTNRSTLRRSLLRGTMGRQPTLIRRRHLLLMATIGWGRRIRVSLA